MRINVLIFFCLFLIIQPDKIGTRIPAPSGRLQLTQGFQPQDLQNMEPIAPSGRQQITLGFQPLDQKYSIKSISPKRRVVQGRLLNTFEV